LGFFEGFALKLPQGDEIPLTPSKGIFSLPEGVQRGFAPLQVQDSVLRFWFF
jgi:hypothetical protein